MTLDLSALIVTASRPAYWGYALALQRVRERLTPAEQAQRLGIDLHRLALLSLCLLPREGHESEDLAVVAERVGLTAAKLMEMMQ